MLILAVNTATPDLGAALLEDGLIVGEILLRAGRPHAETLLPVVEDLLRKGDLSFPAIDAFACAIGPGSYTGIRIGVSAIKAMAYASGKPVVGISTLEALAWPFSLSDRIIACPVLDARNFRIYAAAFSNGRCLVPEDNWLASKFRARLAEAGPAECLLIGNLPEKTRAVFESSSQDFKGGTLQFAPAVANQSRAAAVALLAEQRLLKGQAGKAADLAPVYLAASQAERQAGRDHA